MQQRLRSHGDSVDDLLLLADWAVERGEPAAAQSYLARALRIDPEHAAARLAQIELLLAAGQVNEARQALHDAPPQFSNDESNAIRRLANSWAAVGEVAKARQMLEQLEAQVERRTRCCAAIRHACWPGPSRTVRWLTTARPWSMPNWCRKARATPI